MLSRERSTGRRTTGSSCGTRARTTAGLVRWNTDDADRFRAREARPGSTSNVLTFLEQRGDLNADERRKVPTTTLRRLLHTAEVRQRLGIEFRQGELYCAATKSTSLKLSGMWWTTALRRNHGSATCHRRAAAQNMPGSYPPARREATRDANPGETAGTAEGKRNVPRVGGARSTVRNILIPRDCVRASARRACGTSSLSCDAWSLSEYTNARECALPLCFWS